MCRWGRGSPVTSRNFCVGLRRGARGWPEMQILPRIPLEMSIPPQVPNPREVSKREKKYKLSK